VLYKDINFSRIIHEHFLPDGLTPDALFLCQLFNQFNNFLALLLSPVCPMIFFIPVGLYLSTHMIDADDSDWSLVFFTMLLSLSVLTLNCFFGEGVLSNLDKCFDVEAEILSSFFLRSSATSC